MAQINVCAGCGNELNENGGILLSEPKQSSSLVVQVVEKRHLCLTCYDETCKFVQHGCEDLELSAVLQLGVDKWLEGKDLTLNPATRAGKAREVALQAIEKYMNERDEAMILLRRVPLIVWEQDKNMNKDYIVLKKKTGYL